MKSKIFLLILFSVLFLAFPGLSFAHPGRTAADGCHYCRTRCDYWGVPWYQRHCHGGGIRTIPSIRKPTPKPTLKPILKPTPVPPLTSEPTVAGEATEELNPLDRVILLALLGGFAFLGYQTLKRARAGRN